MGEDKPYSGPCLCGGRGWFEGVGGDAYCSCQAGTEKRRLDDQVSTDLRKRVYERQVDWRCP